ncbi:MAG: hypothetical protein IJU98_06820 [Synergistaceae bacterium]|nr:hypothetical protein [Synergistaceae bacterium]
MRKLFFLFTILCFSLAASAALSADFHMRAKQPFYGTEFDVYRTADMPANWFKTYDGYYVTRRLDTNWVYGRSTSGGLEMTDILVGSVDPRSVAGLGSGYRGQGLTLNGLVPGQQWEAPAYVPPEPGVPQLGTSEGREKVKNPEYLKELKEIIRGLRVVQDNFKKVHLYSYPYTARRHFTTRVPLDFYIVHQRETGHVEFFVNVSVKNKKAKPSVISFNFDGYDGEVYDLIPLSFEEDSGPRERRSGYQERGEFWEHLSYLFSKPLFRKWWPNARGYALRLASNARSTTLPSPVYTTLMQKIANAKTVEIRLGDDGDFIRSGSNTRYKLRGWPDLIWIFQIDEKKRFVESMEARYKTYRKLVELEKRWQPSEEPQPQPAVWLPDQPLSAALIYDIMEAGDFDSLVAKLKHLFGEPQVYEFPQSGNSQTSAQILWTVGEHIRIGLEYRFEGGTWRRNKWEWVSSFVTEKWESSRNAFEMRKEEFSKMLGMGPMPPYKDPAEATWSIWDGSRFTLRLAGDTLLYTSQRKKLDHTVVEQVK